MTKYRVSGFTGNKPDLCSNCGDVWPGAGEWELLKYLELAQKMPERKGC